MFGSDLSFIYDDLDTGGDWAEIEERKKEDTRISKDREKRHAKERQKLEEASYIDEDLKLYCENQMTLRNEHATPTEIRQALTIDQLHKRLSSLENSNILLRKENTSLRAQENINNPLDNPYKPGGGFVQVGKWFVHECTTTNVKLKECGLRNADLGILFRILPLIGFNHNILHEPTSQVPFSDKKQIADYLGENRSTVRSSLNRLEKAGLIIPINGVFVANEDYLICGQISKRARDAREKYLITKKLPRNQKRKLFRGDSPEYNRLSEEMERRDMLLKN